MIQINASFESVPEPVGAGHARDFCRMIAGMARSNNRGHGPLQQIDQ